MKKFYIALILLLLCVTSGVIYVGCYAIGMWRVDMGDSSSEDTGQAGVYVTGFDEESSVLVGQLQKVDSAWQAKTDAQIQDYAFERSQDEERRQQAKAEQEQAEAQLKEQQELLRAKQQEVLDSLSNTDLKAIISSGGAEMDGVYIYPSVATALLTLRQLNEGSNLPNEDAESSDGEVPYIGVDFGDTTQGALPISDSGLDKSEMIPAQPERGESQSGQTKPDKAVSGGEVKDAGYFGQFIAKVYCSCEEDLDLNTWPAAYKNRNFVIADPEFIPSGITVSLSTNSLGFEVRNANGMVTGRNIYVFVCGVDEHPHGEVSYPEVRKVG